MKKSSLRYCILCGREIGEAERCSNPDCGGLPNFYRDIRGPGTGSDDASAVDDSLRSAAALPPPSIEVEGRSDERNTLALPGTPLALLKSVGLPAREYPIFSGETSVGAHSTSSILIELPQVSSRHASFRCREGEREVEVEVVDLGSTNGTFVNDQRVDKCRVRPGDRVRFADLEFVLRIIDDDEGRVTMEI